MKLNNLLSFVVTIILGVDLTLSNRNLPKYFPRCYRDDPDLNRCLVNATDQMRPFLRKGIPELDVPPLSPFYIPEINFQLGTTSLDYKSTLKQVVITGLDNYKFTKFDFDADKVVFTCFVNMGFLNIKGNYSLEGKILSVPLKTNGILNTNITSSNGTLLQTAKFVTKRGTRYIEADQTIIKLQVTGDVQIDYNNLLDGNDVIAKAARNVIEENLQDLVKEVTPAVEEVFTRISKDILFKSVFKIPYDMLYPLRNKQ